MVRGRPRKNSKTPVNKEQSSFSKMPPNQEDGSDQDVLDPKPMRTLAPMFPAPLGYNTVTDNTTTPPIVRVTPYTPFQPGPESGTTSNPPCTFFPQPFPPANLVPNASGVRPTSNGPINAMPISSFKTPVRAVNEDDDDDDYEEELFSTETSTSGRKIKRPSVLSGYSTRSSAQGSHGTGEGPSIQKPKRPKPSQLVTVQDLSLQAPSTGDPREDVELVLMIFDALRRRILQLDEIHDAKQRIQRSDLKAGSIMTSGNLRANMGKHIGSVPGVHVGDIFFFRMEMCVIGLHAPSMGGIDYMTKYGDQNEPVAICIVSAGGYENNEDDPDILIYTGQGGNGDQKLEKGNLALEKSLHRKNPVRVVRGIKDPNVPTSKIYMYDGLYRIQSSWKDKTKEGHSIFKYKLTRDQGQPAGMSVIKMAQSWIENPGSRSQVILSDLSCGVENTPVFVVNEVDRERRPSHFSYVSQVKYIRPLNLMRPFPGCKCVGVCLPSDPNCTCSHSNGSELPYSSTGLLVGRKTMVYECNSTCQCSVNCRNRVSQKGTRLHFEVFKTENRGWGLRSWDPIRAGTFICEYTGEVIDEQRVNLNQEEDSYLFKAACPGEKTLKWNFGTELIGEPGMGTGSGEVFKPLPIMISAKNTGNVSRFMNHSCNPNVFWQPVLFDHGDEEHPHIMFFAMKHIPPMTELTFDYGNIGSDGYGAKRCLCSSVNCRGFFP